MAGRKKQRIKELERRVAQLEAEVAAQRAQRYTWPLPNTPTPYPGTWPQITCTATRVDGQALTDMLKREVKMRGWVGIN